MTRLAVLVSGRGSNLQAILDSIASGSLKAQVALVITDNSQAGALQLAHRHEIPSVVLSRRDFSTSAAYQDFIVNTLRENEIGFIVLAGYLKKVPEAVIHQFYPRIVNIHPALLPAFGGKGFYGHHVHEAVIQAGCHYSGLTIHLVTPDFDRGPVVFQYAVHVDENDTPDSLASKILVFEHRFYPVIINQLVNSRFTIQNNRVIFMEKEANHG
ncbi:MAG: phosphoribosylglycinamide formyltransferase [Candidatus Delongbacteria bacterium]|nr:phosphoribosylglycinamide formyltransferase [Candidatus Delongbacteria bacterium]